MVDAVRPRLDLDGSGFIDYTDALSWVGWEQGGSETLGVVQGLGRWGLRVFNLGLGLGVSSLRLGGIWIQSGLGAEACVEFPFCSCMCLCQRALGLMCLCELLMQQSKVTSKFCTMRSAVLLGFESSGRWGNREAAGRGR